MNKTGWLQATKLAGYIGIVVGVLGSGEKIFGKFNQYTGFGLMLLLLSVSVLVCAILVFAEPYRLFMAKKGREALALVVGTTKWLLLYTVMMMIALLIW